MERIDRIMAHPLFVSNQKGIEELEQERIFCRHGMNHCLDVARILYIKVLEQNLAIPKDIIYATALLHDIGRCVEYEAGTSHHMVGGELANRILSQCGYSYEECKQITEAITAHKEKRNDSTLCKLLYEADKLSRNCFDCPAIEDCYWPRDRKNKVITY